MELYQAPRHRIAARERLLRRGRPLLVLAVLAALVYLLLASAGVAHAQAPDVRYDPRLAAQREAVLSTIYKQRRCMFEGTVAVIRQGVTERNAVTLFTVQICSRPLAQLLTGQGWTMREVAQISLAMADKAYDDAMSWGRP